METLAKLRPAFKKDGTVTAGNAPGTNDGAAAVVVTSEENAANARENSDGENCGAVCERSGTEMGDDGAGRGSGKIAEENRMGSRPRC